MELTGTKNHSDVLCLVVFANQVKILEYVGDATL